MKEILVSVLLFACGGPPQKTNLEELKAIPQFIENEQEKRQEELYERIRLAYTDKPDEPDLSVSFTQEELEMIKQGVDCVRCDIYADDPNMRPGAFRKF